MSIGESLKTYVTASTSINATIGGRMHQNFAPEVSTVPHIWYGRSSENRLITLDGAGSLRRASFDIECIAATADNAIDLAWSVKDYLHGAKSTTLDEHVRGIFVEDHDDSYIPKGIGDDSGRHVAALDVTVWYSTYLGD